MKKINLLPFNEKRLHDIWDIGFRADAPAWANWNAPYFNEYEKITSFEKFLEKFKDYMCDDVFAIVVDDKAIGMVSRYWEDKQTRWLEIGIIIYDENYWSHGIGTLALSELITKTFNDYPEIMRIGLTTWSGNIKMMKLAKKLSMKEEGRLRQVRFWRGHYYDSMKYGILRSEWFTKINQSN